MIILEHLLGNRWVPLTLVEFESQAAADAYMRQMDPHSEYLRLAGGENETHLQE